MDGWWAKDGWVNRWVNEAEIREGRLKLELNMMRTVRRAPGPSRHGLGNAMHRVWGALYQSARARPRSVGLGPGGRQHRERRPEGWPRKEVGGGTSVRRASAMSQGSLRVLAPGPLTSSGLSTSP